MADAKERPYDGENSVSGGSSLDNRSPVISSRTSFSALTQIDADLALARTLQEQERAYMMLGFNDGEYDMWETGSFVEEDYFEELDAVLYSDGGNEYEFVDEDIGGEDGDDENNAGGDGVDGDTGEDDTLSVGLDPSALSGGDEAYARALQDAEEMDMAARLFALARINHIAGEVDSVDRDRNGILDAWEDVDPDELSYEELLALGEVVGNESRGLSADKISSLPSVEYKASSSSSDVSSDFCVICRVGYEEGDSLNVLSCNHSYHAACLHQWLQINKVCPMCNAEVCSSS